MVPFVILLIIFVAAVVFTSLLWQATIPPRSGWGPMRDHHFDAYRAGFQQGNVTGEQYASRGQAEPTGEDLNELARREAQRLHVTRDRNQWMKGFRDGFARGFESFNKEALLDVTPSLLARLARAKTGLYHRVLPARAPTKPILIFVREVGASERLMAKVFI